MPDVRMSHKVDSMLPCPRFQTAAAAGRTLRESSPLDHEPATRGTGLDDGHRPCRADGTGLPIFAKRVATPQPATGELFEQPRVSPQTETEKLLAKTKRELAQPSVRDHRRNEWDAVG